MSNTHPAPGPPSNFRLVFNNTLKEYEKRTKNDLLAHPLAVQLQACDSPSSILAILRQQVQTLHQSWGGDNMFTKWLDPTVNVLFAFSATLGEGVGLVFSPAKVIFAGIGVLLLAAKDVQASRDSLIEIFQHMEHFFQRLEIYTEVSPTLEMLGIIEKILIEVLCILAIATKEIKRSKAKLFLKKLIGRTDLEDAIRRLDKLTHEEARMATAEALKVAHTIDNRVRGVDARVADVGDRVASVKNKLAGVDNRLAVVDDRVASVDERVIGVHDRVGSVNDRVADVNKRLAVVDDRVANVDERVTDVDDKLAGVHDSVAGVDERLAGVHEQVAGVDDRVASVNDKVVGVDEKVAGVDERVAGVDDRVCCVHDIVSGIDKRVRAVDDKVAVILNDGKDAAIVMQKATNDVDQLKRGQLQKDLRKWLSPPDPSTNHNIASGVRHKRTAEWFFQGDMFRRWKSAPSLLWLHGKPGSGKSVLCSTIVSDIISLRDNGLASLAYFYFDFRDTSKQKLRDLLTSLVTQLSARSNPCCEILSQLYIDHENGGQKPSEDKLIDCLKQMLTLPDGYPVYIIIDALDESPDSCGMPSPREHVLDFVIDLVKLPSSNLHLCITSRPEIDIRNALEPLATLCVSLHDQPGQKKDITDYVTSVVKLDPKMRRWRDADKELVIETLAERADGMFRWVYCQLEALRYGFPQSVRHMLDELPETMDATYERVLKGMNRATRDHAHRLLQCLTVAVRPLRVAELAEVLALDFGTEAGGGTSKLNTDWRWEDQQEAVLSTCSSLIAVVDDEDGSQVVQFSHFSVKEFLTSPRLACSSPELSRFHIPLEPAHTILAKACLGVLLRLDASVDKHNVDNVSPLARYAAKHWVDHAKIENVSSHIREGMEDLFDPKNQSFAAWLRVYDIDLEPSYGSALFWFAVRPSKRVAAAPLYYAALCGFQDLAEHLIVNRQDVNVMGGYFVSPLGAALRSGHFKMAQLLYEHGANVDVRGSVRWTLMIASVHEGHLENSRWLISHGADPKLYGVSGRTALHSAANQGRFEIARILLQHHADKNAKNTSDQTPLHLASADGHTQFARVLLEYGADVNAKDKVGSTPLHWASETGMSEVARLLVEHGASVDVKDGQGRTALQVARDWGHLEFAEWLSEHVAAK